MRNDWRARNHPAWWAFLVHRISGLLLTLFLPLHFLTLATALEGEASLAAALAWTEQPLVKAGEVVLIVLLRRGGPPLEAVIMDFGLSRQRDAVLRASQYLRGIGTVQYMALEQLEGQRARAG